MKIFLKKNNINKIMIFKIRYKKNNKIIRVQTKKNNNQINN